MRASLIPPWALVAIAVLIGALSASGAWYGRGVIADRDTGALRTKHAEAIETATKKTLEAEKGARAEEARTTDLLEKLAHVQRARIEQAAALVAANRALSAGVRDAAGAATNALAAEVAAAATPAQRSAAVTGAGLVFADVLGRCSDRLVEVAAWADEAHARGRACEAAFDSVRPLTPEPPQ